MFGYIYLTLLWSERIQVLEALMAWRDDLSIPSDPPLYEGDKGGGGGRRKGGRGQFPILRIHHVPILPPPPPALMCCINISIPAEEISSI
jgi:hypothetical protein